MGHFVENFNNQWTKVCKLEKVIYGSLWGLLLLNLYVPQQTVDFYIQAGYSMTFFCISPQQTWRDQLLACGSTCTLLHFLMKVG